MARPHEAPPAHGGADPSGRPQEWLSGPQKSGWMASSTFSVPKTLLAVLLLAALLRLSAALSAGVMNDEAFTFYVSARPLPEIVQGMRPDTNPPAYYVLLRPLTLISTAPGFLRLPSVLMGVAAVAFVFLAGRRVLGRGALPALVVASAYPVWLADAQIRQYGLLGLAASAAVWLALRGLDRPLQRRELASYLLACCAMPVVNYGGFLILVGLGLGLGLALHPQAADRRRLLGATALGMLPGLAWLTFSLLGPISPDTVHTGDWAPRLPSLAYVPAYLAGLALPPAWPGLRQVSGGWAGPLTTLLGLGLWGLWLRGGIRLCRDGRRGEALLLAAVFLVPLAGFVAAEVLGAQVFQPRYLVPVAAAFALLLLVGAGRWAGALVTLAVGVNLVTAALFPGDPFFWNQDWPGAARWIAQRRQPGDVLAASLPYALMGLNYNSARADVRVDFSQPGRIRFLYAEGYRGLPQVPLPPVPPAVPPGPGRVFLVLCPYGDPAMGPMLDWFNQRYRVADHRIQDCLNSWGSTAVFLLEPLPAARPGPSG